MNKDNVKTLAQAVLKNEADAIAALVGRIDDHFIQACELILHCKGRIVVMGMGKSGHIGGKTAATLASTGTPAFFVHPGEASHGDLGMITRSDVVMAFSNSGETVEITSLLSVIKRLGVPLIALTGNRDSTLARNANAHLDVSIVKEACPLGLAPTTSTTTALAMGDALAISLLEQRGFTEADFALSHPGGSLGKRLLLRIEDVMHAGSSAPRVLQSASLNDALIEMTQKGLGITTIVDQCNVVVGVFTDGDLRRVLDHGEVNVHTIKIADAMTKNCKTTTADALAAETLRIMQQYKINSLPVVDSDGKLVGALNLQDLLRAGVM
ncbi:MAG: KpsF/GutQ family sugar-phosphate isomerase [Gammaproteobacteria bacterium]|nr:KpsF/GutQ family sugar-phosphate isomerase [Gammaproteobacteria bacterium]